MTQPHQRYRHPRYKKRYGVTNWSSYDRSLVNRGEITLWLSEEEILEHIGSRLNPEHVEKYRRRIRSRQAFERFCQDSLTKPENMTLMKIKAY